MPGYLLITDTLKPDFPALGGYNVNLGRQVTGENQGLPVQAPSGIGER